MSLDGEEGVGEARVRVLGGAGGGVLEPWELELERHGGAGRGEMQGEEHGEEDEDKEGFKVGCFGLGRSC